MNNRLNIEDQFSSISGKKESNEDRALLRGHVVLYKNGKKVIDASNHITDSLLNYFARCMQESNVDQYIRSAELMDVDAVPLGGSQDEKDGIAYRLTVDGSSTYYSTVVTVIAAANTYGKRWRGVVTIPEDSPSPSPSGSSSPSGDKVLDQIELGFNFGGGASSAFELRYAYRNATTEAGLDPGDQITIPVTVVAGDTVTIEWEIFFVDP